MENTKLQKFFNMEDENKWNKLIVEDPSKVDQTEVISYINALCNIPYTEFLQYLIDNPSHHSYSSADITQSSNPENCHTGLCKAFHKAGYRGLNTADLASYLYDDDKERSKNTKQRYGRDQATTAKQLGLTRHVSGKWYITCIGLVYLNLDKDTQIAIMGRALLRDMFYSKLLVKAYESEVVLESWMLDLTKSTIERRLPSVKYLFKISEMASNNTLNGIKEA